MRKTIVPMVLKTTSSQIRKIQRGKKIMFTLDSPVVVMYIYASVRNYNSKNVVYDVLYYSMRHL